MEAVLERVMLQECDAGRDPPEELAEGGRLVYGLDVEELSFVPLSAGCAAVVVGFAVDLWAPPGPAVGCDITASFRLEYRFVQDLSVVDQREFAATRALLDAWPYYRQFLEATVAHMGLAPVRLPPTAPRALYENARETYDVCASIRDARGYGGGGPGGSEAAMERLRVSLGREERQVLEAVWSVLVQYQQARQRADQARERAERAPSQRQREHAREAEQQVLDLRARLDAVWRSSDPAVVGRLFVQLIIERGGTASR